MRTTIRGTRLGVILGLAAVGVWSAGTHPALSAEADGGRVELAQAAGKVHQFRLATSLSAKDPYVVRQAKMIEQIKERTKGAVVITMFPSDALMKASDAPKAVARGTVEMESGGVIFYGGISDIAAIITPGFVGISTDDTLRMLKPGSEGRKIFDDHLAQLGIKGLSFWNQADIGFVSFSPLNTVESFKGKKLRVSNEVAANVLQALGAEPTVMGGTEAVDAMRRKIIEGSTCHPTCIVSRGYMDFAQSYTPWTVVPNLGMLSVNLKVWNGLPDDLRKVIQEESDAAAKDQTELVATIQGQAMWKLAMEHGISLAAISSSEQAKLRAIAKKVFDDFVKNAKPQPQATRIAELLLKAADEKK